MTRENSTKKADIPILDIFSSHAFVTSVKNSLAQNPILLIHSALIFPASISNSAFSSVIFVATKLG